METFVLKIYIQKIKSYYNSVLLSNYIIKMKFNYSLSLILNNILTNS